MTAPFNYTSSLVKGAKLFYTRLPLKYSAEQVLLNMMNKDYSFIAQCEGNFIIALVHTTSSGEAVTLIKDRFNSQRVLYVQRGNRLLISNSSSVFPVKKSEINYTALYQAFTSRILTEHALQKDVNVVPLNHGLYYDGKQLDLIEVLKCELKVLESTKALSNEEALALIKRSLNQTYRALDVDTPIAVLLSGGVDSFILAATAQQYFRNICAYTPTWDDGKNPELARAIRFSEQLGIKHRIIKVTSSDFIDAFKETISVTKVPNRNYSSLVLHRLFDSIEEVHILYGEYADSLFGSSLIKGGILDSKYARLSKLIPKFLFPYEFQKMLKKIERNSPNTLYQIEEVDDSPIKQWTVENKIQVDLMPTIKVSNEEFSRINGISQALHNSCAQHMQEIEASAQLKEKVIITPFYNQRMLNISNRLDEYQMFGKSGLRISKNFKQETRIEVKPLLKQLASEYIDRDAIYLRKLGFPTPFHVWVKSFEKTLTGELKEKVTSVENIETKWSIINLYYLVEKDIQ
ncbi:asparagine synthase-related protein [Alteromonas sp. S167]|uniref:asparagine synthase-related protein n=1 Tax=Alteromonas sp. S167 TaxID=3117402 RepID=UPI002FDFA548